jgi:hypothetical protein
MSARNGPRLTPGAPAFNGLLTPSSTIVDVLLAPGTSGTVVYDYGLLHAGEQRILHCPCGRTDRAQRAEDVIAAHLAGAPVGTQAAILARGMANDGTIGPAYLYALAERGEDSVMWPTYHGSHGLGNGAVRHARTDSCAQPPRTGRPQDPGSTTIARTA